VIPSIRTKIRFSRSKSSRNWNSLGNDPDSIFHGSAKTFPKQKNGATRYVEKIFIKKPQIPFRSYRSVPPEVAIQRNPSLVLSYEQHCLLSPSLDWSGRTDRLAWGKCHLYIRKKDDYKGDGETWIKRDFKLKRTWKKFLLLRFS